jgi:hypothetical protein
MKKEGYQGRKKEYQESKEEKVSRKEERMSRKGGRMSRTWMDRRITGIKEAKDRSKTDVVGRT